MGVSTSRDGTAPDPSRAAPAGDSGPGADAAMSARLAQNWWAIALRGACGVVFGLIALAAPGAAMLSLALLFAGYLLADGVLGIIAAARAARGHERWGLLLAEGILNVAMGLLAAFFPAGAVLAFVLVNAAWALLTGGLMLGAAFRLNIGHGRWWLAVGGVVSLLWGALLVLAPLIGAVVLTWWLGGYAIAFGAVLLVLAFKLRGQHARGTGTRTAPQGA
jgi:uncharacterized membrane protein HdeD (DUF308 family)